MNKDKLSEAFLRGFYKAAGMQPPIGAPNQPMPQQVPGQPLSPRPVSNPQMAQAQQTQQNPLLMLANQLKQQRPPSPIPMPVQPSFA